MPSSICLVERKLRPWISRDILVILKLIVKPIAERIDFQIDC